MLPPENGAQPVMGGPQALLGLPPKLPGFEVDGLTGDGKDPRRRQDNVPPRNSGPDVTHSLEEARWIVSGLHLA